MDSPWPMSETSDCSAFILHVHCYAISFDSAVWTVSTMSSNNYLVLLAMMSTTTVY